MANNIEKITFQELYLLLEIKKYRYIKMRPINKSTFVPNKRSLLKDIPIK